MTKSNTNAAWQSRKNASMARINPILSPGKINS